MPTPGERRALMFIASVAALGVAVRGWREFRPTDSPVLAGNRAALARQIEAVDSAIAVTSSTRKPRAARGARGPGAESPGEPYGRAAGAGTARARNEPAAPVPRQSRGGPRLPHDTLPRDPRQAYWDRSSYFDSVRLASARDAAGAGSNARDPAAGPVSSRDGHVSPSSASQRLARKSGPPVDLDRAGIDELASLALIGPALARRIVINRVDNGPFGSILGLERVSGITPAFARRLEPFVTFSGSPRLGSAGESPPRSKSVGRPRGASRP